MSKYNERQLPQSIRDAIWTEFCVIVAGLKKSDDVRRFLSDLMNRQERVTLARRLHIAALLEAGFTYDKIEDILGVGRSTIARVQRWLNFGRGGYKRAINLLGSRDRTALRRRFETYYKK